MSSEQTDEAQAEPDYPDRPHLRDSRQINWCRITRSPASLTVIDELIAEVEAQAVRQRARKVDDQRRLHATLSAIVLDLFVVAETDRRVWLAYSRRNGDYSSSLVRYLSPNVTCTAATEVADFLAAHGYADAKRGSFIKRDYGFAVGGSGYRSRLRATDRLVDLFRSRGVTRGDVEDSGTIELVRLKGSPEGSHGGKPLLPYEDSDETRRMRQQLHKWAEVSRRFDIRAAPFDACTPEGDADADDEETGEYVDPGQAAIYRVFNDGDWQRGGRFYGGWWQSLPKAVRRTITIDGEATVELDFKALHPRMLYHLCGQPLDADADPYRLGEAWREVDRGAVKVAFNQLLAIGPNGRPKKPTDTVLPDGMTYKALLEGIEARHWTVAGWFRDRRASRLQNIDSEIAARVLDYMTIVRGRPVLPVHDSFIVTARDEVMLGQTMFLAYEAVLKDLTRISAYPALSGWSSPEIEKAACAPFRALAVGDDDL